MRKKVIFCAALLFGMLIGISVGALAGVFFAGAPSVPVEVTTMPTPRPTKTPAPTATLAPTAPPEPTKAPPTLLPTKTPTPEATTNQNRVVPVEIQTKPRNPQP